MLTPKAVESGITFSYFPQVWMLDNRTAYAAERNWVRDARGAHQFIVAVKASLEIGAGGRLRLADEQELPALVPEYLGEDGVSSLRCDSDLGPKKLATDVLVNGRAYAPAGRPASKVDIRLRAGPIDKILSVRGDNVFYMGAGALATTDPRPFETMPVVWERAYGGYDDRDPAPSRQRMEPRNPIGVGIPAEAHTPGPNIVHPGQPISAQPAGLLPIPGHWSPRREAAGTYDEKWVAERKPLLPLDYDERFSSSAPVDQRVAGYLPARSRVEVVHMSPDAVLAFEVPQIELRFKTHFGRKCVEHAGDLVTVLIEPDLRVARFVWQTSLRVSAMDVDYLDTTTITELGGGAVGAKARVE